MTKVICEQCKGTGVVSFNVGPSLTGIFRRACTLCDAGNVVWHMVLDLIAEVEKSGDKRDE
jgi:hypothetical protein